MERKYYPVIINNGRIALLTFEDFNAAVDAGKSILLICNGSALIIGANKISEYNYSAYTASISEKTFSVTDFSRFYKIIVTEGIRVYMKTGNFATYFQEGYNNSFVDFDTSYDDFTHSDFYNGESEREFEDYQCTVDVEATKRYLSGDRKKAEEIWDSIKGMSCFRGEN